MSISTVCVFCASSDGKSPRFLEGARDFGVRLARHGLGLVYGGASIGLMGAVADGALSVDGKVTGILPRSLADREIAHTGLTEFLLKDSMHDRKAAMYEKADAFVALPGGYGTLDELFETLVWSQIGLHDKPIAVLNIDGYYDHMLEFLAHAAEAGLVAHPKKDALLVARESEELLNRLLAL